MKISISNIAWTKKEDEKISKIMRSYCVKGVEIAPTKIWDDPGEEPFRSVESYKKFWLGKGIDVSATQSVLYGLPKLTIFENSEAREKTFQYLSKIIKLTSWLGAKVLVFGSPKNRRTNSLEYKKAVQIANQFFYRIGEVSRDNNICFCIEPNPPAYEADFIINTGEAVELIESINHPNFQLHLDAGIMTINGENYQTAIEKGFKYLRHFHISEPNLLQVGNGSNRHKEIAEILRSLGYQNWVSVEMKDNIASSNLVSVEKAISFVCKIYS